MDWTHTILGPDPAAGLMVVLLLIIIEGVLSVDNAAVLATMVMRLPEEQRGKALKYGIVGAYAFRGICLALASVLIAVWWLEPIGGLYLIWLSYAHFTRHQSLDDTAEAVKDEPNWLYRHTIGIPRHFLPPAHPVHEFLASNYFDLGTSVLTLLIFIVPVLVYRLKGKTAVD